MGFFDRRRLQLLVPSPTVSVEVEAKLREVPPDALVELVLSSGEVWWRRRACARALMGRVTDAHAADLLSCVENPDGVTELRAQLLEVLATPGRVHSAGLLGWLQAQEQLPQPYGFEVAVLRTRGALGDLSAIAALSELAADAWSHRRQAGEGALDVLMRLGGEQAVLDAFGATAMDALAFQQHRSMAARLLGVRLVHRAGGDVEPALADTSVVVAQHAASLLTAQPTGNVALQERVHTRSPGHLWALVVLQRRGADVRAAWSSLGSPRVDLPGVPADVREAIVRRYVPGERETDPRWILEAAFLEPRAEPEEAAQINRAERALRTAGLRPKLPVSAGDQRQQGSGTYFTIATAEGPVTVSTLGPFFSAEGPTVDVLRDAGFRLIEASLGSTLFEGLHVYFFGARDPLPVSDLLFYWQD